MRNRRTVDPAAFDHLIGSDAAAEASRFTVNGGPSPVVVEIPTQIAHRIFYLGRAYGSRPLSNLAPGVRVVIGSVDVQAFTRDLRQLLLLVNDTVLHHHVNALLSALELPPGISSKSVAALVGDFDAKRA